MAKYRRPQRKSTSTSENMNGDNRLSAAEAYLEQLRQAAVIAVADDLARGSAAREPIPSMSGILRGGAGCESDLSECKVKRQGRRKRSVALGQKLFR
jgi:hypothetical protein